MSDITITGTRLSGDALFEAAMNAARGIPAGPLADVHTRLVRAIRDFAGRTAPHRKTSFVVGSLSVSATFRSGRTWVTLSRPEGRLVVSGPRHETIWWSLDHIEATEAEALAMLAAAAAAWPRVAAHSGALPC